MPARITAKIEREQPHVKVSAGVLQQGTPTCSTTSLAWIWRRFNALSGGFPLLSQAACSNIPTMS